jgi:hypothetical protein
VRLRKRLKGERGGGRVKKRISLGVLAITILTIGLIGAVVYYNLGFRQRADVLPVAIIKVFTNADQTEELKQGEMIDWGEISTGTYTQSLWINNTGSVAALIGFNYRGDQLPGDWQNYWDYDGSPLAPNDVVQVTITLVLPENVGAGHYEWDSWITAWEYTP